MKDSSNIWPAFFRALGVEHREATEITGLSGLSHPVQAIGVDDKTKRVVVISSEYNPRIAALMQVDIQGTLPDARVLVARPIPFNISHTLKQIFLSASGQVDIGKLTQTIDLIKSPKDNDEKIKELYGPAVATFVDNASKIKLPPLSYIIDALQQLSILDWHGIFMKDGVPLQKIFEATNLLMNYDNMQGDRENGICPLPTYEFMPVDWELLRSGSDVDAIQQRLRDFNIYQYFFPPADGVALSLIDNHLGTAGDISKGLQIATERGHIISRNDIVPDANSIPELL
ncbi:hypothetical protein ACETRX_00225 [Labrys portucalensis]|uniref:Type II secretion system protein GspE N-terminal domain-containing protein n=1 Tax=Labrys neptuniae TaxID=376174 RepID=A0ABV6Z7D3_9HYPH